MLHDHTDHLLTYLVSRLVNAQGFYLWAMGGRVTDPEAILADARKQSRCAKGGRFTLSLHRRYGKHPMERDCSMTVTLHLQTTDNWITFDKRGPKGSLTPAIEVSVPVQYWPRREYETRRVEITKSYRDVWLSVSEAIGGFRAERRREPRHHA